MKKTKTKTNTYGNLNKILIKTLCLFTSLFFVACGGDDDVSDDTADIDCSTSLGVFVALEFENVNNAALAYTEDPTTANCQEYKSLYTSYIDELAKYSACALDSENQANYQNTLSEAREGLQSINCD